jgi:uncharacterized protein YigA (DUF484 family)
MSNSQGATPMGVQGITETDIANFLAASPGFFERHAELLGSIQLTSPHGQRAVSLQERQMEMLRDKIKGLERQIVEMVRLQHQFQIPQAAIRVWGGAEVFATLPFAGAIGDDVKTFASSLSTPYCGVNTGFEAVQWLDAPAQALSLALIPLHHESQRGAFGLLVLASPDPTRYTADMGTEFLARIGEVASAALTRLLPQA